MGVPAKRGRPSGLKAEYPEQARKLCILGATVRELADFFKVDERTIYRWQAEDEAFCQALKVGKEAADDRVEQSLYHRAIGYSHDAVKIFQGGEDGPVIVPHVEHYPPDTTAAIFWLKNRRRTEWRDTQQIEGQVGISVFAGIKIVIGSQDTTKGEGK